MQTSQKLSFPAPTPVYFDLLETWQSRARPIVIWAGAGLSAPADLPSWATLRNKVTSAAKQYVASLSPEQQAEKESLVRALGSIENPWIVFEKLETILGSSNFEAEIRRELKNALKCEVPPAYKRLWKLGINGLLTLNIDRLAQRAFTQCFPSHPLLERSGFDVKALFNVVGSIDKERFIANLHGALEDPSTWVFTETRRKALFSDPRYQEFVRDVLKYSTVVMLGISAHDPAVQEHLARLKKDRIPGSQIFWISSESGNEALKIAEESGIRFISYRNTDGKHGDLFKFFDDIESFSPIPHEAPPVVSNIQADIKNLPSLEELLVLAPNEQRQLLNAHASSILNEETESNYDNFEEFCHKYNRVIHAAGLLDTEPGFEKVLDYTLSALEDSEGGFGTIWRAFDDDGNQVAIKVFKHEIRKNPELLKTFRRGIRSLKILSHHQLPGIVQFKTACEIPPLLVMEWIEGVNLYQAVSQGKFKDWASRLKVAKDLATAIYSAHSAPSTVLHRDIKPQNIMFRDFFSEGENSELVVLDFDLSWHVGALEKSVLATGSNPYLAPEQLLSQSGMTSRSAAVDSYGFGMTLYFLCTGTVPTPFMHQAADWRSRLDVISKQVFKSWRSAPGHIARLIEVCTKHDQNQRPSFSQITADVTRLLDVVNGNYSQLDAKIICEELAARSESLSGYEVQPDGSVVWKSTTQRLRTALRPGPNIDEIGIKFEYLQTGNESFKSLASIEEITQKSHSNFPNDFFVRTPVFTRQHGHFILEVHIKINLEEADKQLAQLSTSISTTMDRLMAASS